MRQLIQHRDRRDIARIARGRFERANAPLAQNHIRIAMRDDVFRRHQQLFDGRTHPPLQEHRPPATAQRFQQREVLHVAGAHLHTIGILRDQIYVAVTHHFGHDREPGRLARLA